ncbi:hypothetical protein V8C86DRAFT_2615108 [Haematococcus lacustris]
MGQGQESFSLVPGWKKKGAVAGSGGDQSCKARQQPHRTSSGVAEGGWGVDKLTRSLTADIAPDLSPTWYSPKLAPSLSNKGPAASRLDLDGLSHAPANRQAAHRPVSLATQAAYHKVSFDRDFPSLHKVKAASPYAPKGFSFSTREEKHWTSKLADAPCSSDDVRDTGYADHHSPFYTHAQDTAQRSSTSLLAACAPTSALLQPAASEAFSTPAAPQPTPPSTPAASCTPPAATAHTAVDTGRQVPQPPLGPRVPSPSIAGWGSGVPGAAAGAGAGCASGAGQRVLDVRQVLTQTPAGSDLASARLSTDALRAQLAIKQSKQLIPVLAKKGDSHEHSKPGGSASSRLAASGSISHHGHQAKQAQLGHVGPGLRAAGIVPGAAGPSSHSALLEAATGGGKLLIKALPVRKQAQQVAAPGGSSTSPGAGEANAGPRAGAVTAAAASKQDGLQTAAQSGSGRSEAAPLVLMDQGQQAPVQQHQAGQVAPPPAQQQEKQRPESGDSQGQQQEGEVESQDRQQACGALSCTNLLQEADVAASCGGCMGQARGAAGAACSSLEPAGPAPIPMLPVPSLTLPATTAAAVVPGAAAAVVPPPPTGSAPPSHSLPPSSCPVQPADLSQPQDEPQPAPAASLFAAPAEEEAFLRSLGWTDGEDEGDDALTEEEIAAFRAQQQQQGQLQQQVSVSRCLSPGFVGALVSRPWSSAAGLLSPTATSRSAAAAAPDTAGGDSSWSAAAVSAAAAGYGAGSLSMDCFGVSASSLLLPLHVRGLGSSHSPGFSSSQGATPTTWAARSSASPYSTGSAPGPSLGPNTVSPSPSPPPFLPHQPHTPPSLSISDVGPPAVSATLPGLGSGMTLTAPESEALSLCSLQSGLSQASWLGGCGQGLGNPWSLGPAGSSLQSAWQGRTLAGQASRGEVVDMTGVRPGVAASLGGSSQEGSQLHLYQGAVQETRLTPGLSASLLSCVEQLPVHI